MYIYIYIYIYIYSLLSFFLQHVLPLCEGMATDLKKACRSSSCRIFCSRAILGRHGSVCLSAINLSSVTTSMLTCVYGE